MNGNPRHRQRVSPFVAGLIAIVLTAAFTFWVFGGRLPWSGGYEVKAVVASAN